MNDEPQVNFEEDKNQLQVIVEESKLPQSKAKYILTKFQDYFNMADEWARTTTKIVVTDASQTHLMDMARVARLAIREKRIAVEKSRKDLKADILREGKAIDGIANVLFALLEPLEEYYAKQENFVQLKEAEKAKIIEKEIQDRLDREFEEEQARKKEEDARIREENETLKEQAYQKEKELIAERNRVSAEQERIKKVNEEILAKERNEREKLELELASKKKLEEDEKKRQLAWKEAKAKAGDRDKLTDLMVTINAIQMPDVESEQANTAVIFVQNCMIQAIKVISLSLKSDENYKKGSDF